MDSTGAAYITGGTQSINFPTLPPTGSPQGSDAFVTKVEGGGLAPLSITVTSNPVGLYVFVDSVAFITPVTVNWNPGSTHPLDVYTPQGLNTTLWTFSSWSHGGARAQTVTATPGTTSYTANFTGVPCDYTVAPTNTNAGADGSFVTITITTAAGCPWSYSSSVNWLTFFSGTGTAGPGTLYYGISPNFAGPRTGSINVAGHTVTVTQDPASPVKLGAFNPSQAAWLLDQNGNYSWDGPGADFFRVWGSPNCIPVVGDWSGDGKKKIGVFNPGNGIWLLDFNGNGIWDGPGVDRLVAWGSPGDIPVVGNWNGITVKDRIGTFNPSQGTWLLDYNGDFIWNGPVVDRLVAWGSPGDKPVLGDWNGSGTTKIGVFNPSQGLWLLDYNGNYAWDGAATDRFLRWGSPSDIPVVGDWTGSGTAKIGVFNPTQAVWLLDYNGNYTWDGAIVDKFLSWGAPGDIPVLGNWDGSGTTKIGVFNPSQGWWVIDYNGNYVWEGAVVDRFLRWGSPGDTPLVGKW